MTICLSREPKTGCRSRPSGQADWHRHTGGPLFASDLGQEARRARGRRKCATRMKLQCVGALMFVVVALLRVWCCNRAKEPRGWVWKLLACKKKKEAFWHLCSRVWGLCQTVWAFLFFFLKCLLLTVRKEEGKTCGMWSDESSRWLLLIYQGNVELKDSYRCKGSHDVPKCATKPWSNPVRRKN